MVSALRGGAIKIKEEPIAYIAFAIVILQVFQAIKMHEPIDRTVMDSLLMLVGGFLGRKAVTPNAKLPEGGNHVEGEIPK